MSMLQEMRRDALSQLELPGHRFFTPTPVFWHYMRALTETGLSFVDCGTGTGELLDEAEVQGLDLHGVDPCYRPGQSQKVKRVNALALEWGRQLWPMFCRPSHDGWASEVMDNARAQRAGALYIGLPRNFELDTSGYKFRRLADGVGLEGERMYVMRPASDRSVLERQQRADRSYLESVR